MSELSDEIERIIRAYERDLSRGVYSEAQKTEKLNAMNKDIQITRQRYYEEMESYLKKRR